MAKEQDNLDDDAEEAIQDASKPKQAPRPPGRRRPARDEEEYEDRRPQRLQRRNYRDEDGAMSSLIPYRNGLALAAYYCGVFALIPCVGTVLGVIAIILGIMGLGYAKRQPEAKGIGHAITGIVLGSCSLLYHLGGAIFIFLISPKH